MSLPAVLCCGHSTIFGNSKPRNARPERIAPPSIDSPSLCRTIAAKSLREGTVMDQARTYTVVLGPNPKADLRCGFRHFLKSSPTATTKPTRSPWRRKRLNWQSSTVRALARRFLTLKQHRSAKSRFCSRRMTGRLPSLKAREVMRALERAGFVHVAPNAATAYTSIATIQPAEQLLPTTAARTSRAARCARSSTKPGSPSRNSSTCYDGGRRLAGRKKARNVAAALLELRRELARGRNRA